MVPYLTINQLKQNKAREYKLINPSDNIFIIYNKVKEKCIYTENSEIKITTV